MEMNEATVDEFLRGSLLTDDLVEKPCNSSSSVNKALSNAQWCENCEKEAKELEQREQRYKINMDMLKTKVVFTDNLIMMYTKANTFIENLQQEVKVLEKRCHEKDRENRLIQTQLKAVLSGSNSGDKTAMEKKVATLESLVEELQDKARSMAMTHKMYEDKIYEMKQEERTSKATDLKKFNSDMDELRKEVKRMKKAMHALERENNSLKRKIELAREKLRRRRRSSKASQATDSEHNVSFISEESTRTEGEELSHLPAPLLSPTGTRKKRRSRSQPHVKPGVAGTVSDNHTLVTEAEVEKNNSEASLDLGRKNEEEVVKEQVTANDRIPSEEIAQKSSSDVCVSKSRKPITSCMKARMQLMKAKRAYRSFFHRPNPKQLKDMLEIVEELRVDKSDALTKLSLFCEKNLLSGHENHVAKKILKLHQNSLDQGLQEILLSISDGSLSSSTETDVEAGDRSAGVRSKKASPSKTSHDVNTKLSTADEVQLGIAAVPDVTEGAAEAAGATSSSGAIDAHVSSSFADLESVARETSSRSTESTADVKCADNSIRTPEAVGKRSPPHHKPVSSLFSSDDEDTVIANILPGDPPSPNLPEASVVGRIRTRSVSKSISDTSDSNTTFAKESASDLPVGKRVRRSSFERKPTAGHVSSRSGVRTRSMSAHKPSTNKATAEHQAACHRKRALSEARDSPHTKRRCARSSSDQVRTAANSAAASGDQLCDQKPEEKVVGPEPISRDALKSNLPESGASQAATALNTRNISAEVATNLTKANNRDSAASRRRSLKNKKKKKGAEREIAARNAAGTIAITKQRNDETAPVDHAVQEPVSPLRRTKSKSRLSEAGSSDNTSDGQDDTLPTFSSAQTNEHVYVGKTVEPDGVTEREKKRVGEDNSVSDFERCRPILTHATSLPFTVGSESPDASSGRTAESIFLAGADTDGDHDTNAKTEIPRPAQLDEIISEMSFATTLMLSPIDERRGVKSTETDLPSTDNRASTDDVVADDALPEDDNDEEDGRRMSISPSADLCTALSFPGTPEKGKATGVKKSFLAKHVAQSSPEQTQSGVNDRNPCVSKVKDAPRRFSCEAPLLARPVPSVRPVTKTKSFDPALLGSDHKRAGSDFSEQTVGLSLSAKVQESVGSCDHAAREEQRSSWTHAASGPFKLVAPASSSLPEESAVVDKVSSSSPKKTKPHEAADEGESQMPGMVSAIETRGIVGSDPKCNTETTSSEVETTAFSTVSDDESKRNETNSPNCLGANEHKVSETEQAEAEVKKVIIDDGRTSPLNEFSETNEASELHRKTSVAANIHVEVDSGNKQIFAKPANKSQDETVALVAGDGSDLVPHETKTTLPETAAEERQSPSVSAMPITLLFNSALSDDAPGSTAGEVIEERIKQIVDSFSIDEALEGFDSDSGEESEVSQSTPDNCDVVVKACNEQDTGPEKLFDGHMEKVAEGIQNAIKKKTATSFVKVNYMMVNGWIAKVLRSSQTYDLRDALSSAVTQQPDGTKDCDLDKLLHKSEFMFVKLVAAASLIREDLAKDIVLPTILKVLCRFGHGLPKRAKIFKDSSDSNPLRPLLVNDQLPVQHTQSLVRLYGALCRLSDSPESFMDLCSYCLLTRQEYVPICYLCCLVPCWPAMLTRYYPLTGKMLLLVFHLKADSMVDSTSPQYVSSIEQYASLVEQMLSLNGGHNELRANSMKDEIKKHWKPLLESCFAKIRCAALVPCPDPCGGDFAKLSVKSHSDVYRCLSTLCFYEEILVVCDEIVDDIIWPMLNQWSQHLATDGDNCDKPVSDACIVATLKGLCVVLKALMHRQEVLDPAQQAFPRAVSYFDTMCALLRNFTIKYSSAPTVVQCATAATVILLSFCNTDSAYDALHAWLLASADTSAGPQLSSTKSCKKKQNKKNEPAHRFTTQINAFYYDKSLRHHVEWLDTMTKRKRSMRSTEASISSLLWKG